MHGLLYYTEQGVPWAHGTLSVSTVPDLWDTLYSSAEDLMSNLYKRVAENGHDAVRNWRYLPTDCNIEHAITCPLITCFIGLTAVVGKWRLYRACSELFLVHI